jgi:hypothetical protein
MGDIFILRLLGREVLAISHYLRRANNNSYPEPPGILGANSVTESYSAEAPYHPALPSISDSLFKLEPIQVCDPAGAMENQIKIMYS